MVSTHDDSGIAPGRVLHRVMTNAPSSAAERKLTGSPIARLSERNVLTGGVATVGLVAGLGLLLAWLFDLGTQQIVFIPSTLLIVVYLLGPAAVVKLLDEPQACDRRDRDRLDRLRPSVRARTHPRPHRRRRPRADLCRDG
jgi:hypothetical protein